MHTPLNRLLVLLVVSGTVLTACHGSLFSYRGRTVPGDRAVFLLEGGPHEGRLETPDLVFTYTYDRNQANLRLTGTVELAYRDFVRDFILRAHWTDCEATILEDRVIVTGGYAETKKVFEIDVGLRLPQFACAMAFSYSGTAFETGFDSGYSEFWREP